MKEGFFDPEDIQAINTLFDFYQQNYCYDLLVKEQVQVYQEIYQLKQQSKKDQSLNVSDDKLDKIMSDMDKIDEMLDQIEEQLGQKD